MQLATAAVYGPVVRRLRKQSHRDEATNKLLSEFALVGGASFALVDRWYPNLQSISDMKALLILAKYVSTCSFSLLPPPPQHSHSSRRSLFFPAAQSFLAPFRFGAKFCCIVCNRLHYSFAEHGQLSFHSRRWFKTAFVDTLLSLSRVRGAASNHFDVIFATRSKITSCYFDLY